MKIVLRILALGLLVTACSQQQARKPLSHTNGTFIKESIERNKKLVADEEKLIAEIIKNDTLKEYLASSKGYWYKYDLKAEEITPSPIRGDIAFFDYEVRDLNNAVIYSKEELKSQKYYVDKENIMMGLRDGIKLMKKGEQVTFIFPSYMGYGYHGDDNKISSNQPLICIVTLNDIRKDSVH